MPYLTQNVCCKNNKSDYGQNKIMIYNVNVCMTLDLSFHDHLIMAKWVLKDVLRRKNDEYNKTNISKSCAFINHQSFKIKPSL